MIINAIIFGVVVVFLWFGLKTLWAQGKVMRIIVICLSAPIMIWLFLLLVKIISG